MASADARDVFWDSVHKVNCCPEHGCIWGHDDCPVVTGIVKRYGEKCPRCEDSARELILADLEARIERREPPPPTQQIGLKCGGPRPGLFGDRLDRIFTAIACTFVCLGLAFGFIAGLIYGVLTS